tara:strand:- start:2179 stop:2556 length:378 start_codon:yes stop_codon:yes gene_type:complete
MNYEEMAPKEFSITVLKAYKPEIFERDIEIKDIGDGGIAVFENGLAGVDTFVLAFNANRPDDVWPIIVDNNIEIEWVSKTHCVAVHHINDDELISSGIKKKQEALRAAMICFLLKMEDGDRERML